MTPTYRPVTKAEFEQFLRDYPRKLDQNEFTSRRPHVLVYIDYSIPAGFAEKIVAKINKFWSGPLGEIDEEGDGRFWEHFVIESHELSGEDERGLARP